MSFGPSKADMRRQQEAAAANAPKPMPDMQDAAIRQARADALKRLGARRGRSSTIMKHTGGSGQLSDQGSSPMAKAMMTRGPGG